MKLEEIFKELSAIYDDSYNITETFTDRNILIANIKSTGRNYNFDKWSDAQLYRMWQRIQQEEHNKKTARKILDDRKKTDNIKYCPECGLQLGDNGKCHKCDVDFGFEELYEGVFDTLPDTSNWVSMSTGNKVNPSNNNAKNPYQQQKSIVTIVYDGNRLRAQADDGQNGKGWVAFPNNLRTNAGQQYEVDGLQWNGKNYRVIGNITPITNNNLRYVISDRKNPDFNDKAFYYFDADPSTGKSKLYIGYLKYFEAGDFTYSMQQAVDKVIAVMCKLPHNDLYLISIDENNKLDLVKSYE